MYENFGKIIIPHYKGYRVFQVVNKYYSGSNNVKAEDAFGKII